MDPLWADLINSDWHDHRGTGQHEDRLWNDTWLRGFLLRAGWQDDCLPTEPQRRRLKDLRELLRQITEEVRTGGELKPDQLDALNRQLAASPVVRRLEPGQPGPTVVLEPLARGMERVHGAVVESFAIMLTAGEPERIKICANPDCGWVMYDESRNRSRRWCDKTECGNLIKVRRHRSRARGRS